MRRVFLGLTFLSVVSLLGAVVYYVAWVTFGTLTLVTLAAALVTFLLGRAFPFDGIPDACSPGIITGARANAFLFLVGITSLGVLLFLVLQHPITTATRSLWLLFSPGNIVLLLIPFLATALLSFPSPRLSALLGAATVAIAASLAALLFPLGFGFDPFLHRATLEHIATFGTISPKPFYYIGAYILELWGHVLFSLPLFFLDVLLAPLALGFVTWIALRSKALHPAILALLPVVAFISTTPQAIGFLWVFVLVIAMRNALPLPYLWLFALAACAAHPLAGVPAIFLTFFYTAQGRKVFRPSGIVFVGIFGIPLLFLAQQLLLGMDVGFSFAALTDFSRIPQLGFFSFHGKALLDTVMIFGGNIFFIVLVLAIAEIAFRVRRGRFKTDPYEREYIPYVLAAIVAIGNFFVLSLGFDFPFLISYERTDFALRLITVAWIFLLPLASDGIVGIAEYTKSTVNRPLHAMQAYGILLLVLLFSANVYVAYPRHDGYSRSAAFNVTPADREIVHRIADDAGDAGDAAYVVLGNQTIASMAVQEFGFFQYYPGDIFAYPIPTSGPLYALFLEMIEGTPNLETVEAAKQLTGASRVYFVVHDYWWEADERIAEAKKITATWFTSDDKTVTVFTL